MKFTEQFELIVRYIDGNYSVDVYSSWKEAYDAACLKAASDLPNETVVAFKIDQSFRNDAANVITGG